MSATPIQILRRIEWQNREWSSDAGQYVQACPCCGALRLDGKHRPGCDLAEVIAADDAEWKTFVGGSGR